MLPKNDVDGLFGALRSSGYRITSARRAVVEALAETAGHLTAADVVEAVHRRAPRVGRASGYRTLELLTRLGLAQSSTLGGATAKYVLTPDGCHHHVVCVECHKTVEFEGCALGELERQLGDALARIPGRSMMCSIGFVGDSSHSRS